MKTVRDVYVVGSDGSTSVSESSLGASHFKGFIKETREKSEEGEREQEADSTSLLFCNMLETLYILFPQSPTVFCVHQFTDEETEGLFKEVI